MRKRERARQRERASERESLEGHETPLATRGKHLRDACRAVRSIDRCVVVYEVCGGAWWCMRCVVVYKVCGGAV